MQHPTDPSWVEGSAAGEPYPPGAAGPARPLLHLVGVSLFVLPLLALGVVLALDGFGWLIDGQGVIVWLCVALGTLAWVLLLLAYVKIARACVVALLRRRRA